MAARARRANRSPLSPIESATDRALGALYGLAIGDALGMPVQELSRQRAVEILGSPVDFRDGPDDNPISRGLPAGSVTDDTMQCVLVAHLLIEGHGVIEPHAFGRALLEWERDMATRGSLDLLGPSTKRALAALRLGVDPSQTGATGTTNGAAMRITPVGIATPLERLLDAVVAADRVTHNTPIAHAGAAVVATIVSAGVDGASFDEAAPLAVANAGKFGFAHVFEDPAFDTGVETSQSVRAAFAVASVNRNSAAEAWVHAAGLGGDADTIAAMAGAMVGACTGFSRLPPEAVRKVREVNHLDFEPIVDRLLELRRS
jgi:ADP-ribosylglycohydrolase